MTEFPTLAPNTWRTNRPYIVTLSDGDKIPAYPVLGKIEEGSFFFGEACPDKMWMVKDSFIEKDLIEHYNGSRIINVSHVIEWEEIK